VAEQGERSARKPKKIAGLHEMIDKNKVGRLKQTSTLKDGLHITPGADLAISDEAQIFSGAKASIWGKHIVRIGDRGMTCTRKK